MRRAPPAVDATENKAWHLCRPLLVSGSVIHAIYQLVDVTPVKPVTRHFRGGNYGQIMRAASRPRLQPGAKFDYDGNASKRTSEKDGKCLWRTKRSSSGQELPLPHRGTNVRPSIRRGEGSARLTCGSRRGTQRGQERGQQAARQSQKPPRQTRRGSGVAGVSICSWSRPSAHRRLPILTLICLSC